MNILISGSTGLIGSELVSLLTENHHRIIRLVRRPRTGPGEIHWDPNAGTLNPQALEGIDAVVHLAGENIASGRWTAERKRRIRESRIKGTQLLAQSLSRLFDPPKVMVSVSAVGYYGDRGDERLDEESDPGTGFLPDLCQQWEGATHAAMLRGIRVVIPRVGMVLSANAGALPLMLRAFRLGVGGKIGSGRQYMSWIAIQDLVGMIHHVINNPFIHGPVNAVSPNPVTNQEFSKTLAATLSRPSIFALPAFAARLIFGEMADGALLASTRAFPERLKQSGFKFRFPDLESALIQILQKPSA
jgi:uncharacterized protein (TIGR01777 family)